jgi:hypothetical protein
MDSKAYLDKVSDIITIHENCSQVFTSRRVLLGTVVHSLDLHGVPRLVVVLAVRLKWSPANASSSPPFLTFDNLALGCVRIADTRKKWSICSGDHVCTISSSQRYLLPKEPNCNAVRKIKTMFDVLSCGLQTTLYHQPNIT